jgi:hypothetical protein
VENKITKIYLKSGSKFSEKIKSWAENNASEIVYVGEKSNDFLNQLDSLLIFNENQSFAKEIEEMKSYLDKHQKSVHKVDINGTLVAGISNLNLWIERSKCKNLLVVGGEELVVNPNFERYLHAL